MRLNRDVLITGIIRHQSVFFQLLDYIDDHDGALEFPEFLYLNLYNQFICKDETSNIHIHLSIHSLLENGVFIHNDRNTGMISIELIIVELLRFLDVKRTKELTHFDFEQLRKRTAEITEHMMSFELDSQDYLDARSAFNSLMSEIHSKIKANVSALTAQVEIIANDYKKYDAGEQSISVFNLYDRISTLYSRYVLPCLEFINPDMEMVRTKTFSKAVQCLIEHHAGEEIRRYESANAFQYRKTAITSYFKDLSSLVKKLEQFSSHLEQDRNSFLAIQSAFSELMGALVSLRHGLQRNKYLQPNAAFFEKYSSLDGLSNRKSTYSPRFNWDRITGKLRFKEYLNVLEGTGIKEKRPSLLPMPSEVNITQERQILITKLLYKTKIPIFIHDVHLYLYTILSKEFSDFTLADVLYGLEAFIPLLPNERVIFTRSRKRITDTTHYLYYIALELKKESVHVQRNAE
ncbi:hypothetical protein [Aeromonas sobria]|uniref:hypothetical protein n=1 Tax=Aeromonas sobria TaxID=646 RepID=UPI0012FF3A62|nr:hypothetical protein [Aeromonas sobria]